MLGQRLIRRLRFLEKAQWWERERLHAHRDRSLATLMAVAYNEVPLYKELMTTAGVMPGDVRSATDLQQLPIVTKEMLREGYPRSTTRKTGQRTYEITTTGSTDTKFRVMTDAQTDGQNRAAETLALEWAGWTIGERHMQSGIRPERSPVKRLKDLVLRCHYVAAFDLSDERLDAHLDVIERFDIHHLWGFPASLYYLARRATGRGWNRQLHSVATWGDKLYPHYRRAIEQGFGRRVFDTYGCGEGIPIAAQCSQSDTYHVHALDTVVEYVDDEGDPVAPGRPGNLLLTRLHAGPMPLIRYRVGDMGVSGGLRLCECGRGFDVMESVQGREADVIHTPAGNRLLVHFFTGILEHFAQIDSYQAVQEEPDRMVLRVVSTGGSTDGLSESIVAALLSNGASDLKIDVEFVDEISVPLTGKRRFIINKLEKSTAVVEC